MLKLSLLVLTLLPSVALAQSSFPTAGGGGARVQGIVKMCVDGSGNALATASNGSCTGASKGSFATAGGGGPLVQGRVLMCLDGSGNAVPKTVAGQCP